MSQQKKRFFIEERVEQNSASIGDINDLIQEQRIYMDGLTSKINRLEKYVVRNGEAILKVNDGLESLSARIDAVEQKQVDHDKRFDAIDNQLAAILEKLGRL